MKTVSRGMALFLFVVVWNRRVDGAPFYFPQKLGFYGLTHPNGYYVKELFTKQEYGLMKADDILSLYVEPSGGVVMFKATLAVADGSAYALRVSIVTFGVARISPVHVVYELGLTAGLCCRRGKKPS